MLSGDMTREDFFLLFTHPRHLLEHPPLLLRFSFFLPFACVCESYCMSYNIIDSCRYIYFPPFWHVKKFLWFFFVLLPLAFFSFCCFSSSGEKRERKICWTWKKKVACIIKTREEEQRGGKLKGKEFKNILKIKNLDTL